MRAVWAFFVFVVAVTRSISPPDQRLSRVALAPSRQRRYAPLTGVVRGLDSSRSYDEISEKRTLLPCENAQRSDLKSSGQNQVQSHLRNVNVQLAKKINPKPAPQTVRTYLAEAK